MFFCDCILYISVGFGVLLHYLTLHISDLVQYSSTYSLTTCQHQGSPANAG